MSYARPAHGGGVHALLYTFRLALRVGPLRLWRAMTSRNACKTCALGMGGQKGGMRNELGHFPEVCKKSLQAMVADMQGEVPPEFYREYGVQDMRNLSPRDLETVGRISLPLYLEKDGTHFKTITWESAFDLIGKKLKAIQPDQSYFYFSGRSSNEAGFLLSTFARLYGTNNVNNCSYYCHQASGVGLTGSIGSGTATIQARDLEKSDLFFLIGGNPASNHPRLMSHLMRMKRRGGKVIVVNPVRETGLINFRIPSDVRSMLFGSKIADEYVQVKIGGDIAFMTGVAKVIIENKSQNKSYINKVTEGFDALESLVSKTRWEDIVKESGVSRAQIEKVAAMYEYCERAVFGWTMGVTHHKFGTENVQWIVNLALLRGMVGRPAAGLMPIRGHSNVQGLGTIGVTPKLKPGIAAGYQNVGIKVPDSNGLDTMGCMDAAVQGKMKFGMALGGNLYGSNPDATYAQKSLNALDMMVYLNTSLNTGHVHGTGKETLILPVLARDEEPYATTQESMFNYVRYSDGGGSRIAGPKGEVDIVVEIAKRVIPEAMSWEKYKDTDQVRALLAKVVPELRALDGTNQEFQIPGRSMYDGKFPTPSGKAIFHAHPIPKQPEASKSGLTLMTVRSEGQFNTVVYEEEDHYRGQERRDVILLGRKDMNRLGLTENDLVTVSSITGKMSGILVREFGVRSGAAVMYYPEANVLVPRDVDQKSLTPAYKNIPIEITREDRTGSHIKPVVHPGPMRQAILRNRRPGLETC